MAFPQEPVNARQLVTHCPGEQLTPDVGSQNVRLYGPRVDGLEAALVMRRLIASMVLLACLLGNVQPALACASCAPQTDCPAGCTPGSAIPDAASVQAIGCCEVGSPVAPSVSAIAARAPQSHAPGSSVASNPSSGPRVTYVLHQRQTPLARTPDPTNEFLTYLRTARLRL